MCIEYQVPSSIGFRKACNFVRTTSHIKDPADPVSFRVESPGGSEGCMRHILGGIIILLFGYKGWDNKFKAD
jgi:hypothetical protein